MMINKISPSEAKKYWLNRLDNASWKKTCDALIKVSKVFELNMNIKLLEPLYYNLQFKVPSSLFVSKNKYYLQTI